MQLLGHTAIRNYERSGRYLSLPVLERQIWQVVEELIDHEWILLAQILFQNAVQLAEIVVVFLIQVMAYVLLGALAFVLLATREALLCHRMLNLAEVVLDELRARVEGLLHVLDGHVLPERAEDLASGWLDLQMVAVVEALVVQVLEERDGRRREHLLTLHRTLASIFLYVIFECVCGQLVDGLDVHRSEARRVGIKHMLLQHLGHAAIQTMILNLGQATAGTRRSS